MRDIHILTFFVKKKKEKKKEGISYQGKLVNVQSRLFYLTTGSERQDGRLCALSEQHFASLKVNTARRRGSR